MVTHPMQAELGRHVRAEGPNRPTAAPPPVRRWLDWQGGLAVLVLAVLFALPVPSMLRASAMTMEEGSLLEYPTLALHGQLPTVNYQSLTGPATEWVPAGAFWIFGNTVTVERAVGLLYRAMILASLYALIRPRWGRVAGVTSAALCWMLLMTFGALAYSWVGGVAFGLAGLACAANSRLVTRPVPLLVLGGLFSTFGLLFRPDLVISVALSSVVLFWGVGGRRLVAWVLGVAVGLVPGLIFVAVAGPATAIRGLVGAPFQNQAGRVLPVPPNPHRLSDFFSRAGLTVPGNWRGITPAEQVFWLFWITLGALAVALVGALRSWWRDHADRRLLVLALFAVGLAPEMLHRLDITHIRVVGSIWVALVPVAVVELFRRSKSPRPPVWGIVAVGLATAVLVGGVGSIYVAEYDYHQIALIGHPNPSVSLTNDGRSLPVDPANAPAMRALLGFMDRASRPGQRLFVGPNDLRFTNYDETYLYWLLPDLVPATYYLEMNPGIANAKGSRLASDVASAKWLILSSRYATWSEPNSSVIPGPDAPNRVVTRRFCTRARMGPYTVLERCR